MQRVNRIITFSFFAALFWGCKKDHWNDLFKPTGPTEIRTRDISGFSKIKVYNKIYVYLTQGPQYEVKVEAGSNLHIGIVTELGADSTLIIRNDNYCNFIRSQSRRVNVYITAPRIKRIDQLGVGEVRCVNQFVQDSMRTNAESSGDVYVNVNVNCFTSGSHGGGDLYASGFTKSAYHYSNGTNYVHSQNLIVQDYLFIESISVCHSHVRAPDNGQIYAHIWTTGNVYYTGNPATAEAQRESKGDLIKE